MNFRSILLSAAFLSALALPAQAADLPAKAPAARMYAPAYSWSGFYLGVNAGYGLASTVIDDQDCNISCSSQTLSKGGFTVGGTAGYNWQMGATVLGIEGDWNWIDAKKSFVSVNWPSIHSAEIKSFGTVRARAGLAVDRTLIYVTGGAAWLDQKVSAICSPNCFTSGFTSNKTEVGLAAGAGLEFAVTDKVTAKLEYLYIALPSKNHIPDAAHPSPDYNNYGFTSNLQVVRAGLNYHF
jgi:outer membrane immunogenic protein